MQLDDHTLLMHKWECANHAIRRAQHDWCHTGLRDCRLKQAIKICRDDEPDISTSNEPRNGSVACCRLLETLCALIVCWLKIATQNLLPLLTSRGNSI